MPHLDGVSATVCIREIAPTIPIVAMTSNIRTDDIDMYFRYGMNDVLPKPFTKEGMLRTLEKHLAHFKKGYTQQSHGQHPGVFTTTTASNAPMNLNMSHISASHSLKDEASPSRSPASSWHSPNQIPSQSPVTGNQGSYVQTMPGNAGYPMTPTHPNQAFQAQNPAMPGSRAGTHRRVMSDMSDLTRQNDHPEKRQRMYPPQPGTYQQQ